MDATQRKIVSLIDSADHDLRVAAIRVVAEIGLGNRSVIRSLGKCLREPREDLQILALKALGRLGAADVAGAIVPLILSEGVLRDHAMTVVTAIGPKAAPHLESLYDEADPLGKRSIVTALSAVGGQEAIQFLLERVPEEPFEVQKHLISGICDALDRTPPQKQAAIFPAVEKLLQFKVARTRETQIGVLNILGHFRGPSLASRARALLMKYSEKRQPPEIRRYALISLKMLVGETRPRPEQLKFFRRMLCDPDWENIAQHALGALRALDGGDLTVKYLVELLRATPHFPVQRHIFKRLEEEDRPEIAREIIPFLSDPRFAVREKAEAALRRLPSAINSLFQVLLGTEDLEVAQRVNSILCDFPIEIRRKYLDRAGSALIRLFDKKDDRYVAFLDFIRSVDPEPLRKRIYQKAKVLKAGRSRQKWHKIAAYLRLLWDNHLITPEGRYLFAISLIREDGKDLSPDARRGNLGLQVIRALIYDNPDRVLRMLKHERDLKAEDLFYLGFHFSEEGEQTRAFGIALLEHVRRKFPRSAVSGPAAHKLETQLQAQEKAQKKEKTPAKTRARASRRTQPAQSAAGTARRLTIRESGSTAAARASRRKSPSAGTPAERASAPKAAAGSGPERSGGTAPSTGKPARKKTKKTKKTPSRSSKTAKASPSKGRNSKGRKKPAARRSARKPTKGPAPKRARKTGSAKKKSASGRKKAPSAGKKSSRKSSSGRRKKRAPRK